MQKKTIRAYQDLIDSVKRLTTMNLYDVFQAIIRDNQLHTLHGELEEDEQCLPVQMLHTMHNLPNLSYDSDLQCHCFTVNTLNFKC